MDRILLPAGLIFNDQLKLVICAQHGSCYVRTKLDRHLRDAHGLPHKTRQVLLTNISPRGLLTHVSDASRPTDGAATIEGLPVHRVHVCVSAACRFITRDKSTIDKHYRKSHRMSGNVEEEKSYYIKAYAQTLFHETKHVDHFIVDPWLDSNGQAERSPNPRQASLSAATTTTTVTTTTTAIDPSMNGERSLVRSKSEISIESKDDRQEAFSALYTSTPAAALRHAFHAAQEKRQAQYDAIEEVAHVTEITPWQQRTRFHAHLLGLKVDELEPSYKLPKKGGGENNLVEICESVERVLLSGMEMLRYDGSEERKLSTLIEKHLNTFRSVETSQDPMQPLQNVKSRQTYINTWKSLVCYYSRIESGQHLKEKKMFVATAKQKDAWSDVEHALDEVHRYECLPDVHPDYLAMNRDSLDDAVLWFCVTLLCQQLNGRSFDSAVISFAAVLAWAPRQKAWKQVGNYTTYLSHLIYDCQLIMLLHCKDESRRREGGGDLLSSIKQFRDKWMLSDTTGPVGMLLQFRIFGFGISKTEVEQAQVRWSTDGETITYKDTQLGMQSIRDLIESELQTAQAMFRRDLCFEQDMPKGVYVDEIRDNWDLRNPGASFLTDSRNAIALESHTSWLFESVVSTPTLARLFLRKDHTGAWHVKKDAIDQYERAVQKFLERLMVLVHVGSGQPARRFELLSMKWCNRQADIRNIFIHDGYVVFILKYHKLQAQLNASRFPVRVMLPAVGELLVNYLLVIMPFRVWLASARDLDARVSEYLWADVSGVWTTDRVTRSFKSVVTQAIGIPLDIRSWRQIAVGIAIKKFGGAKLRVDTADDDSEGGCDETMHAEGLPEAMHWQASHTPSVGNRAYGGTVNFRTGLTDAGLQEFVRISEIWHDFIAQKKPVNIIKTGKRVRSSSMNIGELPLAKKISMRGVKFECRRHWTMQEARVVLRQMYGADADYRSAKQEEAVQKVISGISPVIAVLGTGEGKSLLYMMQQRLPGAGTIVLVVPLVALKQDTVRRCRQFGIECTVWNGSATEGIGNSLVLVSADEAVGVGFQTYLHQLDVAGRLGTIVFDECHLVLTASNYRAKLERTRELRRVKCQFVYLTATLPVSMQPLFVERLLLQKSVVVRGQTVRRDLIYEVVRGGSKEQLVRTAIENIRPVLGLAWLKDEEAARAIVYCRRKADAREVAEGLGCEAYYSDCGSADEKAEMVRRWMMGERRVIAATSALGAGVDYSCVRAVFHVGEPSSAIEFSQEIGRGGRDGVGCVSQVLIEEGWRAKTRDWEGELLTEDGRAMQDYLLRYSALECSAFQD